MIAAQKVYQMLGNENLWQAAVRVSRALQEGQVRHAVCGGVAVCLHGYQRNTVDVDLVTTADDVAKVRPCLESAGLEWLEDAQQFSTKEGIAVQFLVAGERAGKGSEVRLPEPEGENHVEQIEGLPVLRLSKLIEIKLACGLGSPRRTHRDLADVVELIAIRKLDSSFARYLHKSLRKPFRELVKNARA